MFKIEKNIPVPAAFTARRGRHKAKAGLTATFRKLKVGESFFVALPATLSMTKLQNKLTATGTVLRRRENAALRFAVRSVEEGGKRGARVWRLEDRASVTTTLQPVLPVNRTNSTTLYEYSGGLCG